MICIVCGEPLGYSNQLLQEFNESNMSRAFINLKKSLKRHLKSDKHTDKAVEVKALALIDSKEDTRSLKISSRIGRLCYYIIKNGRPYDDLPQLIYICMTNGLDLGDINHSL